MFIIHFIKRSIMTEKQISFSGLNLTPYSDISPDGQLSASVGLEIHDGSIRPSVLAGEKYILPQSHNSAKLLYIHSATSYSHFIFKTVCHYIGLM